MISISSDHAVKITTFRFRVYDQNFQGGGVVDGVRGWVAVKGA